MWSIWFDFYRNCDVFVSIWVYKIVFRVEQLLLCFFWKKYDDLKNDGFSCIKKFCFPFKKFIFYHNFLQKMCGFHLKNRYVSWWITQKCWNWAMMFWSKNDYFSVKRKCVVFLWKNYKFITIFFFEEFVTWGFSFLGGGFGPLFAIWSISSHVGVQIGLKLVRLIALIGLNKFWTNVTSPKSLQKFSLTTFRWSVVRKWSFLVF